MTFSCINSNGIGERDDVKGAMDFLAEMGKEDIILRYSKQIKDHQALLLKSCREVLDK